MTKTTNIGLKKIDGSENWRQIFDYHNDSADKTDSAVAAVQDGLAIVANGNTHAAIASGQFVYVRNHSTLAEGLYKATAAIATNGTLSTSNLTADGSGGLNNLQAQVTSLNSNIGTKFGKLQVANFNMLTKTTITITRNSQHQLYFIIGSASENGMYCWVAGNGGVTKLGEKGSAAWNQNAENLVIETAAYRSFMIISDDIINYTLS